MVLSAEYRSKHEALHRKWILESDVNPKQTKNQTQIILILIISSSQWYMERKAEQTPFCFSGCFVWQRDTSLWFCHVSKKNLPCLYSKIFYLLQNMYIITLHVLDLLHPFMFCSTTTTDGRGGFLSSSSLQAGAVYKLFFDTDCYFKNIGVKGFYPYVEVKFNSKFTTLCSCILHVCFIGEYTLGYEYIPDVAFF